MLKKLRWWWSGNWWLLHTKEITRERDDWKRWCLQAEHNLRTCRSILWAKGKEETVEKGV